MERYLQKWVVLLGDLSIGLVLKGDFSVAHLTGHAVGVITIFFSGSIFPVVVFTSSDAI